MSLASDIKEAMKATVPLSLVVLNQGEHLFGKPGEDLTRLVHQHHSLLQGLFHLSNYPKPTELQEGLQLFFQDLGTVYAAKDQAYFKQQSYMLYQQMSRARKMAHNMQDGSRSDDAVTPLLNLIKMQICSKRQEPDVHSSANV
eukprot:3164672-Amphidinium_carterae.1